MFARGRLPRACLWLLLGCGPENSLEAEGVPGGNADASADAGADASADADIDASEGGADSSLSVDSSIIDAARLDAGLRLGLVRHQLWTRVTPAEDPFADAPPVIDCSKGATADELLGEEEVFSVDTAFCNYVTVRQPALLGLVVGDVVKVRLWHFDLSAPEPAQAHAALTIDGFPILDERISIPAPGGLLVREVRITREIAAGTPVLFHLHNHGGNSWALVEVSKGPG